MCNTDFLLSNSWVIGSAGPLGLTNNIELAYRVEKGGQNNVYVSYQPQDVPPASPFFDGQFGRSLQWQHRGLYQMNLGAIDAGGPPPVVGGTQTFFISNEQDPDPFLHRAQWNVYVPPSPFTITVGANTSLNVVATCFPSATFTLTYGGIDLFGGPITIGGPSGENGQINKTIPLDGTTSTTLVLDGYFNLFGDTYGEMSITLTWDSAVPAGGTQPGATDPNKWNLQADNMTGQTDSGFTLVSTIPDLDLTSWVPTPLAALTNNSEETRVCCGCPSHVQGAAGTEFVPVRRVFRRCHVPDVRPSPRERSTFLRWRAEDWEAVDGEGVQWCAADRRTVHGGRGTDCRQSRFDRPEDRCAVEHFHTGVRHPGRVNNDRRWGYSVGILWL